ncbi:indolepyruvate ferredoxin oxidoreductase, beta subunit [uncultured Gammaproteobacteria bacterium]
MSPTAGAKGVKSAINILVVGIGGQGVMTAAEILAQAAIDHGFDVKKSEIAGMAQRGGVVTSHVRIGPRVLSPVIMPGCADLLVAFEEAEALRWADQVRSGGQVVVNTQRLVPLVVSGGLFSYPDDPVGQMRAAGLSVHAIDAAAIALGLGERRLINTVMLGAIAEYLPFTPTDMEEKIVERFKARKPALASVNRLAFQAGRRAVAEAAAATGVAA